MRIVRNGTQQGKDQGTLFAERSPGSSTPHRKTREVASPVISTQSSCGRSDPGRQTI